MLNEIVVKNKNDDFDTNRPDSLIDADELLNHINQSIVPKKTIDNNNNKTNHPDQQRTILLQKLDRMIKTIKEHHEQESNKNVKKSSTTTNLKQIKCKSLYDISKDENFQSSNGSKCLSTPQLSRLSISKRPKSSYGRSRLRRSSSRDESISNNSDVKPDHSKSMLNIKKSTSLANVQLPENGDDD
ncbi:hypothetical protein BLA29_010879, partial [Euroglyphus maynei]